MQKIYIDSRFRTANSKSESDFNVELPRSFNVPDGVVAHIDDIVIPVSWSTIDERNNTGYVAFYCMTTMHDKVITFDSKSYTGDMFATALQQKLTEAVAGFTHNNISVEPTFSCAYDVQENILTIGQLTNRTLLLPHSSLNFTMMRSSEPNLNTHHPTA